MREVGRRGPEGGNESQIEQQLERSRDTVCLVWIASAHPAGVMVEAVGVGRRGAHA
jgi:hypothetical protein